MKLMGVFCKGITMLVAKYDRQVKKMTCSKGTIALLEELILVVVFTNEIPRGSKDMVSIPHKPFEVLKFSLLHLNVTTYD